MLFTVTRRVTKPDSSIEEQQYYAQASSLKMVLDYIADNVPLGNTLAIRIEQSKSLQIFDIPDPLPPP